MAALGFSNLGTNLRGAAHLAQDLLPFDPTPGFNLTGSAGGGVPFVQKTQGYTPAPITPLAKPKVQDYNAPPPSGGYDEAAAHSAADAQQRAATLFGIDSGLQSAEGAMGRLDNQFNIGQQNIGRDYQDAYGRLQGQQQIGQRNYDQNRTGQLNEYQSNRNQVGQQARTWMDSARRTLGAQGAGGGSAARYAVPYEAQTMAATGNANAQATNNRNITALDQGWQDDQNNFTNSFRDLDRQRTQGENDLRSRIDTQRADLNSQMGQLQGQRAIANGGDFRAAQAAANPYTSRINQLLGTIDSLAATPAISERAVTLNRPDLQGYNWAQQGPAPVAQQDPTLSNPNFHALFGIPQDDRLQYA